MFPLYDTARSRIFPLVNLTLIVANILAFLYELQMGSEALNNFIFNWGLIPAHLISDPTGSWKTIYTSMFLHGGWFHILSNMWVLFIFGDNIEARMGKMKYLIFYLLSGTAAGLLQTYILPSSQVPMIGASGAIAGVLGAYLVLFPRSRVASLVPIFFIFTIIEIPAVIFLIFWFLTQIYSGWFSLQGSGGSGIAWWAHVGGFIFGLTMSFFFANRRRKIY
jgi:membrane associated rhomboid family serine protease